MHGPFGGAHVYIGSGLHAVHVNSFVNVDSEDFAVPWSYNMRLEGRLGWLMYPGDIRCLPLALFHGFGICDLLYLFFCSPHLY